MRQKFHSKQKLWSVNIIVSAFFPTALFPNAFFFTWAFFLCTFFLCAFFRCAFFQCAFFLEPFHSYHCFTHIFLFIILLELIFFTLQHSFGYLWLVSVVHSTSLAAFSFSCYFRVLQTGILRGLGLFLRFWVFARTCFLFATLPT